MDLVQRAAVRRLGLAADAQRRQLGVDEHGALPRGAEVELDDRRWSPSCGRGLEGVVGLLDRQAELGLECAADVAVGHSLGSEQLDEPVAALGHEDVSARGCRE